MHKMVLSGAERHAVLWLKKIQSSNRTKIYLALPKASGSTGDRIFNVAAPPRLYNEAELRQRYNTHNPDIPRYYRSRINHP